MAFAGAHDSGNKFPSATAAFESVYKNTAGAGDRMVNTLKNFIGSENDRILIEAA